MGALAQLLPPLQGDPVDLLLALHIALAVLLLRLVSERLALPALSRALARRSSVAAAADAKALRKRAYNTFNNSFIAASSALMSAWAWAATLTDNGGCTPLSTDACLAGWPAIPVAHQFRLVWLTVAGFYVYEMLGTLLRVTQQPLLSGEMMVHHVVTLVMMLYGYFYSLHRYGLMATALLDTSNALLHVAKALNYAAIPALAPLKDAAFKAFAATFFVCRVALPPFALIKPGLLDGRAMPLTSYYITNGLLLFIYSLQLFWFSKIVRIALGGSPDGDDGEAAHAAHAAAVDAKVPTATDGAVRAKGE